MATRISKANGNWNASSTWNNVATGTNAQQTNHGAATVNVSNGGTVTTPNFTGNNGSTTDGVLLALTRNSSTSGTLTVELLKAGVSQVSVTVNCADLPAFKSLVFFKFTSNHTFDASTTYAIRVTASASANNGALFGRSSTANDLFKLLRLTTSTQPVATDVLVVVGELTGAGTSNSWTVTFNETVATEATAATDYGLGQTGASSTTNSIQGVDVGAKGTLTWASAASTIYKLRVSGNVIVWSDGKFQRGTTGTPYTSTATAILELDCPAIVDYGFFVTDGGILEDHGAAKTYVTTMTESRGGLLSANGTTTVTRLEGQPFTDYSNGDTVNINGSSRTISSITNADTMVVNSSVTTGVVDYVKTNGTMTLKVADTTGWRVGDSLHIASSTRAGGGQNLGTITTVDSSTQVTLSTPMTNGHWLFTHNGRNYAPHVANNTRNVKMRGVSTSLTMYANIAASAVINSMKNNEYEFVGSSTAGRFGFHFAGTAASITQTMEGTVLKSSGASSRMLDITTTLSGTLNIIDVVMTSVNRFGMNIAGITIAGTLNITRPYFANNGSDQLLLMAPTITGSVTITDPILVGAASSALHLAPVPGASTVGGLLVTNPTIYGSSNNGIVYTGGGTVRTKVTAVEIYRCGAAGLLMTGGAKFEIEIDRIFGCANANIQSATNQFSNLYMTGTSGDGKVDPGANYTTVTAWTISMGMSNFFVENVRFGSVTPFTTVFNITAGLFLYGLLSNVEMNGTSEITNQSAWVPGSYIGSQKHDQTAGVHKTWYPEGTVTIDTTIADADPSARLTPLSATEKLSMKIGEVGIDSGTTKTISVKVRRSVVGDGTAHNGNHTQLVALKNVAAGISTDTVIDTATSAEDGAWETLSGTSPAITDNAVVEFVVRTDGTQGWINVDTASVS